MQKVRVVVLLLLMTLSNGFIARAEEGNVTVNTTPRKKVIQNVHNLYDRIDFGTATPVSAEVFARAYFGYLNLKEKGTALCKNVLTICDFSLSSNTPRMWVIDLDKKKVLFHTLVAHGQGTGDEFATQFSNRENSHQSSVGFFITGGTYTGDNGYSLRLNGMDKGYNDRALERAIVVHGADYVSNSFIKANQRLGRSWGCPAVSRELAKPIIETIKGGSCLFIYYPDKKYFASSQWLQRTPALRDDLLKDQFNVTLDQAELLKTSQAATLN